MIAHESMAHVIQGEAHPGGLVWLERLGMLPTLTKTPAHRLTAHQRLLPTSILLVVRRQLAGIDVDHLDHPVGVLATGGNPKRNLERTGHGQVLLERLALIHQHVGTARCKALILGHIILGLAHAGIVGRIGHRTSRIADELVMPLGGHRFLGQLAARP